MFRLVRQSVKCMMLIEMPCLDFSSIGPSHNHMYCVKKNTKKICSGILIVSKTPFEKKAVKVFALSKAYCLHVSVGYAFEPRSHK